MTQKVFLVLRRNLLQAQSPASTPNQTPIAGNMKNFMPGTMGKWQSHAAEVPKHVGPCTVDESSFPYLPAFSWLHFLNHFACSFGMLPQKKT